MSSIVTALCAAALIAASASGRVALCAVLAALQAALAAAWFWRAGLSRRGQLAGAIVAVAGAVAADVTVLLSPHDTQIRALAGVLAAVVGAAFVVQLARRDGREGLAAALTVTVAAGALAIAGAVLLGVRDGRGGVDVVAVALVAVGAGLLPVQRRVPWWASLPVGLALGVGVGYVAAGRSSIVETGEGLAIAAVAVAVALAGRAALQADNAVQPKPDDALRPDAAASSGAGVSPGGAAQRGRVWAGASIAVEATLPVLLCAPGVLVVARIMLG